MHRSHTNACGRVLLTEQPPQTICGATHQRECTQSRMKMQKVKSLFKEYAIFKRALNKSLQRVHTAFALKIRGRFAIHFRGDLQRGLCRIRCTLTGCKRATTIKRQRKSPRKCRAVHRYRTARTTAAGKRQPPIQEQKEG